MLCTVFENIFAKKPHYVNVSVPLKRIKDGNSRIKVEEIRACLDKDRANEFKKNLTSVCFSGKFGSGRKDDELIKHSGFIVLDFDGVEDCQAKKEFLMQNDFMYASWISPSGHGVKGLVRIANGNKHREHFQALKDIFTDADNSGINQSRVCYESYDPEILVNEEAKFFTKTKVIQRVVEKETNRNEAQIYDKILKWLTNKGDSFVTGERNNFIFKLASACCRFGIGEQTCHSLINISILSHDNKFTEKEAELAIKSAYNSNKHVFGNAEFSDGKLVDIVTRSEIKLENTDIYDLEIKAMDVVFGEDVKQESLEIYDRGYKSAHTTYIPEIDYYWKWKQGEVTLLSGIGNYGKSAWMKYLLLLQIVRENAKVAIFSPEEFPASEFYHDLVEIYFGAQCTAGNPLRPSRRRYEQVYDFISKHIFFIYPKDLAPTPEYIKERFLELIIKEKCTYCLIDPFNQMSNNYKSEGGRADKYLEVILADFSRFAQKNNVFFLIIAHPVKMQKDPRTGNYPCPDVFDLADGAMWNNKMDNILIYHLPERQTNPQSTVCEFHSKKIRRRKIVGQLGSITFEFIPINRRFKINGKDYMQEAVNTIQEPIQDPLFKNDDDWTEPPF